MRGNHRMVRSGLLLSWLLAGCLAGCAADTSVDVPYNTAAACEGTAALKSAAAPRAVRANGRLAAEADGAVQGNFMSSGERKMSYRAHLVLQCQDVPGAVRETGEIARRHQGYVAASDNESVRLKVPVEEADAALAELEALGKVVERRIAAQDVTEQYVDTQVRLENLQKLHDKLTELLKRAKNVDETLKVERELARVTTDLERYQAMMKNLALRVAMVEMSVFFRAVLPAVPAGPTVPIPWVAELGTEIARGDFPLNRDGDVPFRIAIPAGFAVLYSDKETLYAVNSADVVLKLSRRPNFRDADAEFYQSLMERSLFGQNGYRKTRSEMMKDGRYPGALVAGERLSGKAPVLYEAMLMICDHGWFRRDETVYLIELWGKPEAVEAVDRAALLESVRF